MAPRAVGIGLIAAGLIVTTLLVYGGSLGGVASQSASLGGVPSGSASGSLQSPQFPSGFTLFARTATTRSVQDLGPVITLAQADQYMGPITPPTALVDGLTLEQIRGTAESVALIYTSPSVPPLADWNGGNMIVFISRDNTTYSPVSNYAGGVEAIISCDKSNSSSCTTTTISAVAVSQTSISSVMISGNPGSGYNPQSASGIGMATWWANGIHYVIMGDLPLSTLVGMADSMNT